MAKRGGLPWDLPIKLETGDAFVLSSQPENAVRSGHNRRMTRPCNATRTVVRKREQLRSGKPPSAGLTFIIDKPSGECRFSISSSTPTNLPASAGSASARLKA